MITLCYQSQFDWATNIAELASKLRSLVNERIKTRKTMPEHQLQAFDASTEVLRAQAMAAEAGRFWWDPKFFGAPEVMLNPTLQEWRKQANLRGKLQHPDDPTVSRHSFNPVAPLLISR